MSNPSPFGGMPLTAATRAQLDHELRHLHSAWIWLLLLGILLAICGTAAIVLPALTVLTSFAAVVVLGVTLMIAGVAIIFGAFWAGKWSGFLLHLLVGVLYLVGGFVIADHPGQSTLAMTLLIASLFIVLGTFRLIAALVNRFPQWGWVALNGAVTLLAGLIIYRHFPESALWAIGLLVGLEMLFNGWAWIMLALAVRSLPPLTEPAPTV